MIFDLEPLTRLVGFASGIHVKTQRIAERELRAAGLTYPQFGTLAAIAERDSRTQRELADRLETDANTLMVICDSLQRKGLVMRRNDPSDRRIRRISMTPRGSRSFTKGLGIVRALSRPLTLILTEQEIARALPVLERLYGHLKDEEQKRARGKAE